MTDNNLHIPSANPSSGNPIQDVLNKVSMRVNKPKRMLGISAKRGRYDLAFENDGNAKFLIVLSALMGFLSVMALSGGMAIGNITKGWASDLQNTITIEIPAYDSLGVERKNHDILEMQSVVQSSLQDLPYIEKIQPLTRNEIYSLVKTWLGGEESKNNPQADSNNQEYTVAAGIPLPGLVSVTLAGQNSPEDIKNNIESIKIILGDIDQSLSIDTHEEWLGDIVRVSRILQTFAIIITGLVMAITVIAIAGGIKSRMEVYHKDIELLHLMGAQDEYIARQFQIHALSITLKGTAIGLSSAAFLLLILRLSNVRHFPTLPMPEAGLSLIQYFFLIMVSGFICAISSFVAHRTVLRNLRHMP